MVFLDIKLIKVDDDMNEGRSMAWIEVVDQEILRFNKEQMEQMIKLYKRNKKIMFSEESIQS